MTFSNPISSFSSTSRAEDTTAVAFAAAVQVVGQQQRAAAHSPGRTAKAKAPFRCMSKDMTRIKSVAARKHHHRLQMLQERIGAPRVIITLASLATGLFLVHLALAASGNGNNGGSTLVGRAFRLRGARANSHQWVPPQALPFNHQMAASHARHLVVVAGHSVLMAGNLEDAETDENVWYLMDYQVGKGLPQAIVAHIRTGIEVASGDPEALLIFSGGETRGQTGPVNEGVSYFRVADALDLWSEGGGGQPNPNQNPNQRQQDGTASNVRARTTTEEFATDSFENLMFSICRFREITGRYPDKITMVSFTFKQRRFEEMHSHALRWPIDRFAYLGVDPPTSTGFNLQESQRGEVENASRPFEADPYGCHTPVLQQKRKDRNPFSRTAPYPLTCPDMSELLSWCGPELIDQSHVPWSP